MIPIALGEIAELVSGRLVGAAPDLLVTGPVEFDSRLATAGGLFLALPGEHVDGHDYALDAIAHGALAAIVTRPVAVPHIEVGDALTALAALAAALVRRLPDLVVVAVTGSSGKTTTKDLLADLLSRLGPTVAPRGSFNNELGHPYTVLRADLSTRFLVLEASARKIGDIRHLAAIAPPRIGVVLNVGTAHLGEFGSREAIAAAKGELVEALAPAADAGVAVLNADDPMVLAMAARTTARIVTVGQSADAQVRASDVRLDELGRPAFVLHAAGTHQPVQLGYVGAHQVGNALAAAAVALECGAEPDALAEALAEARPASRWRMELHERADGVLVLNDAYNANPESAAAALRTLAAIAEARGSRSVAVLGTMAELGAASESEHEALGRLAAQLDISRVIAVGEVARSVSRAAGMEGSWHGRSSWVPDPDAAVATLRNELRPRDVVLVKASRAASLEQVAQQIADDSDQGVDGRGGTGGGAA